MPSAGLIETPPVSNVMPLPMKPSTGDAGAPGGSWRMHDQARRRRAALRDAQQQAHAESSHALFVEHVDAARPRAARGRDTRSANSLGVSTLAGSLARPRAKLRTSPMTRPRRTAASIAPASAPGASDRDAFALGTGRRGRGLVGRRHRTRADDSHRRVLRGRSGSVDAANEPSDECAPTSPRGVSAGGADPAQRSASASAGRARADERQRGALCTRRCDDRRRRRRRYSLPRNSADGARAADLAAGRIVEATAGRPAHRPRPKTGMNSTSTRRFGGIGRRADDTRRAGCSACQRS